MKFRQSIAQRFERIQKENRTFINLTELQDRLERCRWRSERPKVHAPSIAKDTVARN